MQKTQPKGAAGTASAIPAHLVPTQARGGEDKIATYVIAKTSLPDEKGESEIQGRTLHCTVTLEFMTGMLAEFRVYLEDTYTTTRGSQNDTCEFTAQVSPEALPLIARTLTAAVERAYARGLPASVDTQEEYWQLK